MAVDTSTDTKTKIIEAAVAEFVAHGFDGARMQKIADQSGVTKAMIHYYFNTKKELFEQVYNQSVKEIFEGLSPVLEKDNSLFKKIEELVDECLKVSKGREEILSFVLIESRRKNSWLVPYIDEQVDLNLKPLEEQLKKAASNYEITSVDVSQLMLNIFALCYYPVLSSPINKSLFNSNSESSASRKGIVLDTILNWLTA